ncbi:MAG: hypothetical protein INQ03_18195 [Candidatus Heimdallarchaeota archaeon]|nr:hypothetical protein [Candidatus Heimdallarchaeota archaeon]
MNKDLRLKLIEGILWIFVLMALLANFSTLEKILNQMLTTGDPLPLQSFLNQFIGLWGFVDAFWILFLTDKGYHVLFIGFAWGGFTFTLIFKNIINYVKRTEIPSLTEEEKKGRYLTLFYAFMLLLANIYGYGRDLWIPYSQQPSWIINIVHKQQISGGSYMMVFLFVFFHGGLVSRAHKGSRKFYMNKPLMTLMFILMYIENAGAYNWFGWGIVEGYVEIFRDGQTWTTFDKFFHFAASTILTIILMMYIQDKRKIIGLAIFGGVFWELFEISLNPLEYSDSWLDMVINSSAIIITILMLQKFEKPLIETQSLSD